MKGTGLMSKDGKTFVCKKEDISEKITDSKIDDFKSKFMFNAGGKWYLKVPGIQQPEAIINWLEKNL